LRDVEPGARSERLSYDNLCNRAMILDARGRFGEEADLYVEMLARAPNDEERMMDNLTGGLTYWNLGRYAEAKLYMQRGLSIAGKVGELGRAWALRCLGYVLHAEGEYAEAEKSMRESVRLCEAFGDVTNAGYALHGLGLVLAATGRPTQARAAFQRSLVCARGSSVAWRLVEALTGLASAELACGHPFEARRLFEEGLALYRRPGAVPGPWMLTNLAGLGLVALVTRDLSLAHGYLQQALAVRVGTAFETAYALMGMAEVLREEGQVAGAAELLAFVEAWPNAWHETRLRAGELLGSLDGRLTPEVLAAAAARGRAQELEHLQTRYGKPPG
jgi:tetratricopeptide (TPR) repeat protein